MLTECKMCAGTGNLGGGDKDAACKQCGGSGRVEVADEAPSASAPTPAPAAEPIGRRGRRSRPN